ncbi:hypothetical protein FB45DRAFT_757594 [Roridomyces roridus]|uniref:T6SS Phospholipase effector Tle1-like catalytic domain-containing protein n=1 Tax=Roridomyces roridus TaxID=1738132 RepID=A0AAD7BBL6_9AGAR|nr:hypothetical protein FB45DRAFT_757594 [Roridomyces roridus]
MHRRRRRSTSHSVGEKDRSSPSVPPTNRHRCLILCFDGTDNQFGADNSNVVQLVSALKKDDCTKQMVYYQTGIGTYTSPRFATPMSAKISQVRDISGRSAHGAYPLIQTVDAAIAWNLDSHVMSGYEFLMQNYTANDRICIFGFSRGAYIARSLAGMIHKVGLLPVDNYQQVPFAYRMYARTDATGWAQSNAFKKAFSNDVHIDFLGVWDTVDSVGLIRRRLPFTASNTIVRTFRHAVSLDERRAKFQVNLWNMPHGDSSMGKLKEKLKHRKRSAPGQTQSEKLTERLTDKLPALPLPKAFRRSSTDSSEETEIKNEEAYALDHARDHKTRPTDVLEVWFAGCHGDVGGGAVPNETPHSLARIPLRWMIRETFKAGTGMLYDPTRLRELGLDPDTLYPEVRARPAPLPAQGRTIESIPKKKSWFHRLFSRAPDSDVLPENSKRVSVSEEEEELYDSLAPIYDGLKLEPLWWILELIPMRFRHQRSDWTWESNYYANLGRPRRIPHQRPAEEDPNHYEDSKPSVTLKVHRSVETRRMARDAKGRAYVNRARFRCEPEWVD